MIRKFLDLCKHFYKISKINEYELFLTLQKDWNSSIEPCPFCHAPHTAFHKDGHYKRDCITYFHGVVQYHQVTISCVECSSCGHSHALLPSFIIPYSSYSVHFLISLLFHYYKKTYKTVEKLCAHYQIAISTFYRILHCFLRDNIFLKSVVEEIASFDALQIITYLANQYIHQLSFMGQQFFDSYGYSFHQRRCTFSPKT